MDEDMKDRIDQVRELGALPPDQLAGRLANAHGQIAEIAPNLLPHIQSTAMRAVQFLNSKLPPKGNELLEDESHELTASQRQGFHAYHEIINDPASVLAHVKHGTLNPLHMEALKSIYPDIHGEMKSQIIEHLADMKAKGRSLPFSLRNSIGTFLEQPLDSTATFPAIQTIMNANAGAQKTAVNQGKKKNATGAELNQINKVNQIYATRDQARELTRRS